MKAEELRACYVEQHRRLYLVALAITLDRQKAEDAVHDALLRLLKKRRRPNNITAYVVRTVRNAAIDIVRKGKREEPMQQEFLVDTGELPDTVAFGMLDRAFVQLHRCERETILLRLYAGMTFKEIANLRRRSINTVSAWYRRGIEKLQVELKVENE